jgi:hypothetical protein
LTQQYYRCIVKIDRNISGGVMSSGTAQRPSRDKAIRHISAWLGHVEIKTDEVIPFHLLTGLITVCKGAFGVEVDPQGKMMTYGEFVDRLAGTGFH